MKYVVHMEVLTRRLMAPVHQLMDEVNRVLDTKVDMERTEDV